MLYKKKWECTVVPRGGELLGEHQRDRRDKYWKGAGKYCLGAMSEGGNTKRGAMLEGVEQRQRGWYTTG